MQGDKTSLSTHIKVSTFITNLMGRGMLEKRTHIHINGLGPMTDLMFRMNPRSYLCCTFFFALTDAVSFS